MRFCSFWVSHCRVSVLRDKNTSKILGFERATHPLTPSAQEGEIKTKPKEIMTPKILKILETSTKSNAEVSLRDFGGCEDLSEEIEQERSLTKQKSNLLQNHQRANAKKE